MSSVSVVVPTHNRGPALAPTLDSACKQTYIPNEIIVVDDASTDDTNEVAASFKDSRIKLISHTNNRGVSGAINTAIRAVRGDLIAILEHDDIWLPDKLEKQLPLFDDPEVGLVYCGVGFEDENGVEQSRFVPQKRGDIYRDLLFKSHIPTSSAVVVCRDCFEKAGLFDETLQGPQDYDMWIRITRQYKVDFVPDVLVRFAAYQHQRLNNPSRLAPMYYQLNRRFETYDYPSALFKRRVMAYRHYSLGGLYGDSGQQVEAGAAYRRSLSMWPFNMKCWAALTAASAGPKTYAHFARAKVRLLAWRQAFRVRS